METTRNGEGQWEGGSWGERGEGGEKEQKIESEMVIGKGRTKTVGGMKGVILRGKKERGGKVMVEGEEGGLPAVKRGRTTLESALAVLEALRGRDAVVFGSYLVAVGRTPAEALARAEALLA